MSRIRTSSFCPIVPGGSSASCWSVLIMADDVRLLSHACVASPRRRNKMFFFYLQNKSIDAVRVSDVIQNSAYSHTGRILIPSHIRSSSAASRSIKKNKTPRKSGEKSELYCEGSDRKRLCFRWRPGRELDCDAQLLEAESSRETTDIRLKTNRTIGRRSESTVV